MRATIDLSLCQGYGNCVSAAPEYFDLDDSGQAVLLKVEAATPAEQDRVREAIPLCPVGAIRLEG
ncbi:ferredoxin [Actinomadura sp. SCN-SB]|uniref:ferredoxin n=1 Tax=Actinomadura sp. SCN-SB TaxID=3373092 RepID=UPI003753CC77